jgi:hypothetical protein
MSLHVKHVPRVMIKTRKAIRQSVMASIVLFSLSAQPDQPPSPSGTASFTFPSSPSPLDFLAEGAEVFDTVDDDDDVE